MEKIVSFKKDIVFDTNIGEINSISLEFEVDKKEVNLVSGKFLISGDYKMVNTSNNLDDFDYRLPFNINIDKKYDASEALIDISDFYYEVLNNKILSVSIDLSIDNLEKMEIKEEVLEDVIDRCIEVEDSLEEKKDNIEEISEQPSSQSIFENLDSLETYSTYKVHIIRENDTIESIILDYKISREKLEDYNDLVNIKTGDKLIIPANEN